MDLPGNEPHAVFHIATQGCSEVHHLIFQTVLLDLFSVQALFGTLDWPLVDDGSKIASTILYETLGRRKQGLDVV